MADSVGAPGLVYLATTVFSSSGADHDSEAVERWQVDVRSPGPGSPDEVVPVGRLHVVTVRDPESEGDVLAQMDGFVPPVLPMVLNRYADQWESTWTAGQVATGLSDVSVITDIVIEPMFRDTAGLLTTMLNAVVNSAACRHSVVTFAVPSDWADIPGKDRQVAASRFAQMRDTDVFEFLTDRIDPRFGDDEDDEYDGEYPVGARSGVLWLEHDAAEAMLAPGGMQLVAFPLPPALDPTLTVPEPVESVAANPNTGELMFDIGGVSHEVVGQPGNAPQLVGASADADPAVQAWLREAHTRWWTYQPSLHARIHDLLEHGDTFDVVDEDEPHLHLPVFPHHQVDWPGLGHVDLQPVDEDDTGFEDDQTEFEALLIETGNHDDHEHIGVVRVSADGRVQAFLHDDWRPEFIDHEQAVAHLLSLGADQYYRHLAHDMLDIQLSTAILTGEVHTGDQFPGH